VFAAVEAGDDDVWFPSGLGSDAAVYAWEDEGFAVFAD
jgi:hypothetical protein